MSTTNPISPTENIQPLVQVRGLKKYFPVTDGMIVKKTVANVKAVDGVTFDVQEGESQSCFLEVIMSDPEAEEALIFNLGDCETVIDLSGCMDPEACNYNAHANEDDGSCAYEEDCAGVCEGVSYEDECGTCDDDSSNDCIQDCAGEWGGDAVEDECGVCAGDGYPCQYPDISISPESLSQELESGESATQTLTIFNDGLSDLEWMLNIGNLRGDYIPVPKVESYTITNFTGSIQNGTITLPTAEGSVTYTPIPDFYVILK